MTPASRIRQVFLFVLVLIVLDRGIAALVDEGFRGIRVGGLGRVNRAIELRPEVVVLGSSRAYRHYDTEVLGEILGMRAYNTGEMGQDLPFARGVAQVLLEHYTPRLFLVNVDPQSIVDLGRMARVRALAPYIDEAPAVRALIYALGPFERVKYLSRSYRYNETVFDVVKGWGKRDASRWGFEPRRETPDAEQLLDSWWRYDPALREKQLRVGPDPRLVAMLRDLIRDGTSRGTRVVLVRSPMWRPHGPDGEAEVGRAVEAIASEEGVPFVQITFDGHPRFQQIDLWADPVHLNAAGASLFSRMLGERLLELEALAAGSPARDPSWKTHSSSSRFEKP